MAEVHQLTTLVEGISCFAWNSDQSMIAISPNSNEIHIYGTTKAADWQRLFVLSEHDLLVSSIDWSAVTNKIVSCSHDRNAFVWTYEEDTNIWKPTLVILRIDRAATDVKWSLDGQRFAVASSAKVVPVCMYEPANDWWVSKMVKKHKSTVLCCAFHPTNGQLMATGSSDFKCRIFSTFDADVDGTVVNSGPFPQPVEFGEVYAELSAQGWVNAVAWSPSGESLAFAGHDCTLHVASFGAAGSPLVRVLQLRGLPLSCLVFLTEKAIVGAGYDFEPLVFTEMAASKNWTQFCSLDAENTRGSNKSAVTTGLKPAEVTLPPPPPANSGGVAAARAMFQSKTSRGQDSTDDHGRDAASSSASGMDDSKAAGVHTMHCRAITGIARGQGHQLTGGGGGGAKATTVRVATSGMDGKLVIWDVPMMNVNAATMSL